ncbi:MAG: 50S ribosomal protein L21e [Candidatus Aenigmarchaeota archaeon]|nr:50S ribosomal protein L21e [Candidatus Aenigmarchaeota archaeon]NIP39905.1 50S ribosomal protein L21e [Candidatus Aenigmarchaeota archaeon]NIQ17624.1 50S ribosomal protein L21e [Candidatus Aenigmarchaeota archaeon]NIS72812.1 50S ribosomal protein L21e [Candidatus Aenigmarchaeota archaeon]
MVKKSRGMRRGTRSKMKRGRKDKFKVAPYLQAFEINDRVVIKLNPSSQRGFPDPVFEGRTGKIKERRGRSYVVELKVGKKTKNIIARPEHLIPKSK